jgi:hypothetical protein
MPAAAQTLLRSARTVEVTKGWIEEHCQFLASQLEPWPFRAMLEKEFLRAGCRELDTALWLLREGLGLYDEADWLSALVRDPWLADLATRFVTDCRRANPLRRLVVDVAARRVTWLGQDYQVTEELALFLDLLNKNRGKGPLTEKACMAACPRLAGGHFRRNLWKKLPPPLREITRSRPGYGWWLELL